MDERRKSQAPQLQTSFPSAPLPKACVCGEPRKSDEQSVMFLVQYLPSEYTDPDKTCEIWKCCRSLELLR